MCRANVRGASSTTAAARVWPEQAPKRQEPRGPHLSPSPAGQLPVTPETEGLENRCNERWGEMSFLSDGTLRKVSSFLRGSHTSPQTEVKCLTISASLTYTPLFHCSQELNILERNLGP